MKTKVFYEVLGLESKKNKNRKIEINRVVMNSKEIKNKDLFVAIRGGNNFINEALEKGAYIVYDNKNVIIDATNSSSMLRFMEEGNENYIYLIMPVNIRV